jgi:hypothetical protein
LSKSKRQPEGIVTRQVSEKKKKRRRRREEEEEEELKSKKQLAVEERKTLPLTETILTNVSILFVVATLWNYLQQEGRLTPARRTWLLVAGIFAMISPLVRLFHS